MSFVQADSNQLLCMDQHCASGSSSKDVHSPVEDDYLEEKIWRKKVNSVLKRWKKESIVLRRGVNGIELFSQESDSFTIMACNAEVKPFYFKSGLSGKNKNIKIGFKVRFEQRSNESEMDSACCEKGDHAQTRWSIWYEFRTKDLFSTVNWVTTLDPTINSYGLRETLLGFKCSEACCDGSGPETWLCKWDEIHPSMLDVQSQYIRVASDDRSSSNKHKSRRSSRAYSRARAFSVNESSTGQKVLASNSSVNIHDNFVRPPDSPEVQPPRYSDVVGRSSICTYLSPEDLAQETFQEFSPPTENINGIREQKEEWSRRKEDDTFLPPYGPAKIIPLNMGMGEEIGLPPNIQKMWDPGKKKVIYVDHVAKKITLHPPEDKSRKKHIMNDHPLAPRDRLSSIIPDCQRLSTRRMTSVSTLGTTSSGGDISPGDERWLPCYLETQLSAPCGTQADSLDKRHGGSSGLLPQIEENTDSKDFRIKILRPVITVDMKASHSWLNMADIMDVITAEHIAQQAFSKPVAVLIDSSGSNGQSGWNGESGQIGGHGVSGRSCIGVGNRGEAGHHGGDGVRGENGGNGEDGGNGQDIEIWLSVEEQENKIFMKVSGAVDALVDIESDRIVFVSCKGGQGGNGGSGGTGGSGGNGGDGGIGGQGMEGDGGAGGNGGNGGCAGSGGNGGRGGNGGNGGIVTIHASDPRLFMLVECDIRGGTSGNPGTAGRPGVSGKGGKGGVGGKGAYFTSYRNRAAGLDSVHMNSIHQRNALIYNGGMASPGSGMFTSNYDYNEHRDHGGLEGGKSGMPMTVTYVGKDGPPGLHGKPGLESESGLLGEEGCWGVPGCIRWIVTNKSAEESSTPELNEVYFFKYNVEVLGFEVFSDNDDGIMEPNEAITVSNIKIINTGQMTLPIGAILTFPSTRTMRSFPDQYVTLPEIPINEVYEVKDIFRACIHDVTSPNSTGPFFSHVDIESRVTLLNREFLSAANVQNFSVQYPISLTNVETPKQMGRGEESSIKIELTNCSSILYGTKPGATINQETNVELKIRLDRRLMITRIKQPEPSSQSSSSVSQLILQPNRKNGVSMVVSEIPIRNGKLEIILVLVMENRAELFDSTLIQVELYLRNRLIEYEHYKIRVAPYYHALSEPGDALFITGPDTTRASFLRWEFLLNSLGMMDIDFWDIERYKGLSFLQNSGSRHEVTWIDRYKGKMIIFPHYEPHQISGWDICCHFGLRVDDVVDQSAFPIEVCESSDDDQLEKTESLDSSDQAPSTAINEHDSSIILISDSCDQEMDKAILVGCLALLRVTEKAGKYGGYHLFNPAGACYKMEVADKKLEMIMSKLRKQFPNQVCVAYDRNINYEMMSSFYWSYGEINIRKMGLNRDSMLTLFCTGADRQLDIPCHPSVFDWIPIIGQWAQVYLVMLASLGVAQRSSLIRLNPDKPVFMLPWGDSITIQECAVLSIQPYLQNELFPNMKNCWRMEYLCKDIEANPSHYQGRIPLILFTLWKYRDRTLTLCSGKQLYNKIRNMITSVQKILRDYYGDRNIKTWNIEANKLMKDGLKLKFSDLVDQKYSFHPSRLGTRSDVIDLSKHLTENEYKLIESVNSLSN